MFDKNRLMRSILPASGILVLLLLSGCGKHTDKPHILSQTETRFRDYKVIISETGNETDPDAGPFLVEIFKGKTSVYKMSGFRFYIGNYQGEDEKKECSTPIGMDITGEGQPDLVIFEWTGGAHCCHFFHIFEIGTAFRHIQTIDLEDFNGYDEGFKNLDDDPALELLRRDYTFAYWNECFAGSPAPKVILKYSEGQYNMAPKLMKKLPRRQVELYETAAKIRSMRDWKDPEPILINPNHQSGLWKARSPNYPKVVPSDLWREMLNLIYTGNMAQAWKFLDLAWPEGMSGKQEFLEEFKAQLATSPYWEQIQNMNKPRS